MLKTLPYTNTSVGEIDLGASTYVLVAKMEDDPVTTWYYVTTNSSRR